jgi:hypothetical protein
MLLSYSFAVARLFGGVLVHSLLTAQEGVRTIELFAFEEAVQLADTRRVTHLA